MESGALRPYQEGKWFLLRRIIFTQAMKSRINMKSGWNLLWKMETNINEAFGFRVALGTEYTMALPFQVLEWQQSNSDKIKHKDNYLLLYMYPVKKMIEVIPE